MTTINCNFKDATGTAVDGYIIVGVDSWLMKDDQPGTVTTLPGKIPFVAGVCTLNLEPSDVEQVTYWFEVYHYKSTTTSDPETGEPVITIVDEQLLPRFYAQVPYSATAISFNLLTKQSGINRDNIDTAISAITRRLYNEDTFWYRLQQNLFVPKGDYSSTAWYSRGDLVTWEYGSYLYYYPDRTQGIVPSTTTHWQQIGFRGATGAGTTGNDSPFGVGWNGQTDAPSRNAVYDAMIQYALASTVSGLAPLASPTFTGTPTSPTPTQSDNTTKIATTQFVQTWVTQLSKALVPVGTILNYAGTSSPTGWVLCDGRVLDRTAFAALFAILGTTYNTGGETGSQFRVPDLRGRTPIAPDNMGGTAANRVVSATNVALVGGLSAVTLSTANLPSHAHALPGSASFIATGAGFTMNTTGGIGVAYQSNTSTAGSDVAHENMPPYITLNYIIYTGV